jgi:LysM repeat protein
MTMFVKRMLQITLIVAVLAAFVAIPRSVSAAGPCGNFYIVQPGDWLTKIAERCGVSLSALYAANPGVAWQLYIYPGQVLNIPDGGSGGALPAYPPPGPVTPFYGCADPFCQSGNIPPAPGAVAYHWYPNMIVTPRVGGSYFTATVSAGTQFTFEARVLNNGDVPLQVIALLDIPSGWDLNENYDDCPDALHVGAVCTFSWVFTPRSRGSVLTRVYVRGFYTDPYGSTQRVTASPGFVVNVY